MHYFFAKSIWMHFLFREFTLNPFCFARSLWINYLLRVSLWIHYLSRELTICFGNSPWIHLLFLQNHYKFEWRWICYPFHCNTVNSLFISRIFYEFTICFANLLWINYPFREITVNSLSFSRISYKFTTYFAISSWIHFFFANSLFFTRIHYLFRDFSLNSLSYANSRSVSPIHLESSIFAKPL